MTSCTVLPSSSDTSFSATAAEALELLLARRDDLVHCLARELGHELLGHRRVVLGLDRLEDLLDVRGRRRVVAAEHGHEVGGAILHPHGGARDGARDVGGQIAGAANGRSGWGCLE